MIKHLENELDFEKEVSTGLVFVDFFANWCNPCKMLGKVFEQIDDESYSVLKIDVDQFSALANKFSIESIPHIIIFKDGKQVGEFIGYRGSED